MNNGKTELPSATELAMIAAQLYDNRGERMADFMASNRALRLWKACQRELEIEGCIKEEDARIDRQPVPFDQALKDAGFTEQTAAKRETAFSRLLTKEGVFDLLSWPNTEVGTAIELLKKSGFYREQIDRVKFVRAIRKTEIKQMAGRAKKRKS